MLLSAVAHAGIRVRVDGLQDRLQKNVLARLSLEAEAKQKGLTQERVDDLAARAPVEIQTALQPFGYYHPKISGGVTGKAPDWSAHYRVKAGPRAHIRGINLSITGAGHRDQRLRGLLEHAPFHIGQPLYQPRWEKYKSRLLDAAFGEGYLDAHFSVHKMLVHLDSDVVDLDLTLETGERYYIGPISIHENKDLLDDQVIRRYMHIHTGQPFDPQKLLDTQFSLSDLGYFSSVEVDPDRSKAKDRRVPVAINTHFAPQRQYRYGVGYGTDTGARALWSIDFRRLGREGHKLHVDLRLAQKISAAIAEYRVPIGHDPSDYIGYQIQGLDRQLYNGREDLWGVGTSYNLNGGPWQKSYYLKFVYDISRFTNGPVTISHLLTPGVQLTHADLDRPILPRFGWRIFTDFHGAAKPAISSATFVQGHVILNGVVSPLRHLRLLGRAEYGGTLVSGFAQLPASQRFFAGGTDSVRGYPYQSLGPKDAQGNVIGGRFLQTYSLEGDYQFYKSWGAGVFADAGGAGDTPHPKLYVGVGAGVLYYLPFGAAAVYLAHPLDSSFSPVRLEITVKVGL
jgi:Outer membrane protein